MAGRTLRYLRSGVSEYTNITRGVRAFLAAAPLANPEEAVRRQLAQRESVFLERVRTAIFGNPGHPYARMFELAGCSWEDLAHAVRSGGLEATLERLRAAGVYLSHDEFKGMRPIVRGGREIPSTPASFHGAEERFHIPSVSSGSRSAGTHAPYSVEMRLYQEAHERLLLRELGLMGCEEVVVFPVLPSGTGYIRTLRAGRRGDPVKWFAPGGGWRDGGRHGLATGWMMAVAKASGIRVPLPEGLPPSDFLPALKHIEGLLRRGRPAFVNSMVTSAVRIARAASERGTNLSGATFVVTGEPLTAAKRAVIEKTGAEARPVYSTTEISMVGLPCSEAHGDCVHFLSDSLAVIGHRKVAEISGWEVNSLFYTTLLPFSPFLLINLEMDDHGIIGRAACDCSLSRLGLTTTIREVLSFGKLTGMGVTLLGTQLLELLERTLPGRFGGGPGDYQLLETEENGQYGATLRVSPAASKASEEEIRHGFLSAVEALYGGRTTTRVWTHGGVLRVERAEPVATGSGKVLALHLLHEMRRNGNGHG